MTQIPRLSYGFIPSKFIGTGGRFAPGANELVLLLGGTPGESTCFRKKIIYTLEFCLSQLDMPAKLSAATIGLNKRIASIKFGCNLILCKIKNFLHMRNAKFSA